MTRQPDSLDLYCPSPRLILSARSTMVQPISPDNLVRVLRRSKQNDDLGRKISQAIELIQGVLDGMTEDAIALSFNGGKDCTVLLHLFAAVLYARHSQIPDDISLPHPHLIFPSSPHSKTTDSIPDKLDDAQAESSTSRQQRQTEHIVSPTPLPYPPIKSIYITAPNHFEELDSFTEDSVTRYGMDLYRFGGDMKAALTEYLRCGGGKGVKGVLVGTRSGDPNGRASLSLLGRIPS
jgi:FAD synthetase